MSFVIMRLSSKNTIYLWKKRRKRDKDKRCLQEVDGVEKERFIFVLNVAL